MVAGVMPEAAQLRIRQRLAGDADQQDRYSEDVLDAQGRRGDMCGDEN